MAISISPINGLVQISAQILRQGVGEWTPWIPQSSATDDRTLLFPCFDGNGMWLSAGNIAAQSKVRLLFIDFEQPNRLRVQGSARLRRDPAVLKLWPEVGLAVEVAISRVWVNCPRYIHQMARVDDAPHVPKAGIATPVPEWKLMEVFADVVPPAPHQVKDG